MKKKFSLTTTQIIMLSFLVVIFLGSLLLSLPISSAEAKPFPTWMHSSPQRPPPA